MADIVATPRRIQILRQIKIYEIRPIKIGLFNREDLRTVYANAEQESRKADAASLAGTWFGRDGAYLSKAFCGSRAARGAVDRRPMTIACGAVSSASFGDSTGVP